MVLTSSRASTQKSRVCCWLLRNILVFIIITLPAFFFLFRSRADTGLGSPLWPRICLWPGDLGHLRFRDANRGVWKGAPANRRHQAPPLFYPSNASWECRWLESCKHWFETSLLIPNPFLHSPTTLFWWPSVSGLPHHWGHRRKGFPLDRLSKGSKLYRNPTRL